MPPTLHPHLKRGLDFDDYHVDPEDVIEPVPLEALDPEEHVARRRRVERIAAQYLRGRRPVILAAGLRGPFNDDWKNPWAKAKKSTQRQSNETGIVNNNKMSIEAKKASNGSGPTKTRRRSPGAARSTVQAEPVASPETSRAVGHDVEDIDDINTSEAIEIPPATAPSPDEEDTSGSTEYFSAATGRCVPSRSPLTNPFWLRRPESEGNIEMKRSADMIKEVSPTHSRDGFAQRATSRTLRLAMAKAPLGAGIVQPRAAPQDIAPSTSTSMLISSPVKVAAPTANDPSSAMPVPHLVQTPGLTPAPPCKSSLERNQTSASTRIRQRIPVEPHPHGDLDDLTSTLRPPSREDIQLSVERLEDMLQSSSGSNGPWKQTNQEETHVSRPIRKPQHNVVASPAPNSSTGFAYKKVATKWTIGNAPRSKPRAVNFNSSPSVKNGIKSSLQGSVVTGDTHEHPSAVADMPTQAQEVLRGSENPSVASRRSSGQSMMSTQAAMLLAQLEFQESTFPTSSDGTSRPWSQMQEATPRPTMTEVSPAITPLSMFRPQLEQPDALTSVLREAPISTQDLFAAASPFAFSTVKKRPIALQHSNLSVAMLSFDGADGRREDATPRSPLSSAGQRPFQEKNTVPSPRKRTFQKSARGSQAVLHSNGGSFHGDVESPQLDLHGSMDDYGPGGSFHLAQHLLHDPHGT